MSIRAYRDIHRRKSRQIMVGKVLVGGDAPITVQTMTNTITGDARATIDQIRRVEEAGADIVRVSCPDEDATAAMKAITRAAKIPVVADIHFHYKRAIEAAVNGAACLRINPGNIGSAARGKGGGEGGKEEGCFNRLGRAGKGSGAGGQGSWLFDAHRCQCRIAGAGPVGKIWRTLSRGDGRKR